MVVFTCNACSAVLKKNQVDKHCYQCRRCESLSCVDCGKDFWGNDYQNHTKCITEEEKYGGKDNVPKVFKGEAKQEQWVEQVQNAIERASSKPKLKQLLWRLREYPNIPRKKAKFENFVKNSLRVYDTSLITEVWDELMVDHNKGKSKDEANDQALKSKSVLPVSNGHSVENNSSLQEDNVLQPTIPKNKREKKEERRKNAHKKEKKDKSEENTVDVDESIVPKKSKKRKRTDTEESEENGDKCVEDTENSNTAKEKKKKKKKRDSSTEVAENGNANCEDENTHEDVEEAPPAKRKKTKFNWEKVIKAVLEKKGEMTLKKLKKKVLGEFAAQDAANYNEDNLSAKFDKKIMKTEGVKVSKDRASLKAR